MEYLNNPEAYIEALYGDDLRIIENSFLVFIKEKNETDFEKIIIPDHLLQSIIMTAYKQGFERGKIEGYNEAKKIFPKPS